MCAPFVLYLIMARVWINSRNRWLDELSEEDQKKYVAATEPRSKHVDSDPTGEVEQHEQLHPSGADEPTDGE